MNCCGNKPIQLTDYSFNSTTVTPPPPCSGGAVANACKELLPRFVLIGAHLMQAAVNTVRYERGMIVGPQKSIPLREVAEAWYLRPQELPPDVDRGGLETTLAFKPARDTGAFVARNSSAISGMSRPLPSSPREMPTSAMS